MTGEPHNLGSTLPQKSEFKLKKAVIDTFGKLTCPMNRTLDIETLRQYLLSNYAHQLFKCDGQGGEDNHSMNSSNNKQEKALNDRLKKLLSRYDKLFIKGPKMYALPIKEQQSHALTLQAIPTGVPQTHSLPLDGLHMPTLKIPNLSI